MLPKKSNTDPLNSLLLIQTREEIERSSSDLGSIYKEKIKFLSKYFLPLTESYQDRQGYEIRLWSYRNFSLFATVLNEKGHLKIIRHICNRLSLEDSAGSILQKLIGSPFKNWHLVYLQSAQKIFIWPVLEAAGRHENFKPDPNATGPHSVYKVHKGINTIHRYATFISNTNKNYDKAFIMLKRYDGPILEELAVRVNLDLGD